MSFLEGYLQGRGMQQRQRALEHQEDQDRLDTGLRRDTLEQAKTEMTTHEAQFNRELALREKMDAANRGLQMMQTMMGLPLQWAQILHLGAQAQALANENKLGRDRLQLDQQTVGQSRQQVRQQSFEE